MRRFLALLPAVVLCLGALLTGCVSQKELPYLQSNQYSKQTPVTVENTRPIYTIQPNDILSIKVQSTQPALSEIFNPSNMNAVYSADAGNMFLTGYSVGEDGYVNLPTVGKVKVGGMTLADAQVQVQQQVSKYVRDANVLLKLSSFKVTVLGDVRNPGRYYFYNGQATVLEALGMAGDLNRLADRKTVKLVRQTLSGGSEVVLLDLTDPELLKSKYYYMQPNDALYVAPLKVQISRENVSNLGLVFSGITALALVLSYLNIKP